MDLTLCRQKTLEHALFFVKALNQCVEQITTDLGSIFGIDKPVIYFISSKEVPRTTSGKVQRNLLASALSGNKSFQIKKTDKSTRQEPNSLIEKIRKAWAKALSIEPDILKNDIGYQCTAVCTTRCKHTSRPHN